MKTRLIVLLRKFNIFFLFVLMPATTMAQNIDSQRRNISLIILDKKERPMSKVLVRSLNTAKVGFTDRKGLFVFADMSDNDTVSMMLPKYGEILIPVVGMDSIVVKLRSARSYYYVGNDEQSDLFKKSKRDVLNETKTESTDLLDVQEMMKKHTYRSLVDLLQTIPGLSFSQTAGNTTSANIRGASSINGTNEPLIVLDGVALGSFSQAENLINIYDIKTIEVQRNATQFGAFGANGAILIKTK